MNITEPDEENGSTDCPTCPACEATRKPSEGFLSLLSAPARRALINIGITELKQLSTYNEKEILSLHGMGKASIAVLTAGARRRWTDI